MDGWESRRKRTSGHDWCIIKLGLPGQVRGIEIDTAHFTGNQAPRASIQAMWLDPEPVSLTKLGEAWKGERIGTAASEDELRQTEELHSKVCQQEILGPKRSHSNAGLQPKLD
ncbi:unnamed protein product [Choristocarpus tenellus]